MIFLRQTNKIGREETENALSGLQGGFRWTLSEKTTGHSTFQKRRFAAALGDGLLEKCRDAA
jgi:hypothetical protein